VCRDYACSVCSDDAECKAAYGDPDFICEPNPGSERNDCRQGCDRGAACGDAQVCGADNRCGPCSQDRDCVTAYRPGFLCLQQRCVRADCRINDECDGGRRICEANACRDCLQDAECGAGRVCGDGLCRSGDCHPSWSICGAEHERVCSVELRCQPCEADAECRVALGSDAAVCELGRCGLGCAGAGICAAGELCGADHRCRGCHGDAECGAVYGDGHLCVQERCIQGECRSNADCAGGQQVCRDYTCRPCVAHEECGEAEVCADGRCLPGNCTPPGSQCADPAGGVCGAERLCRACADDQECRAALGSDHAICGEGECELGCDGLLGCGAGELCGPGHRCEGCGADGDCVATYGADHLCIAALCLRADCRVNADCDAGQRACVDNLCRACELDVECDPGRVCADGVCLPGDCHPPQGACGQEGELVCGGDRSCRACAEDGECRVSLASDSGICEDAACELGCDGAAGCPQGLLCRQDHRCSSCVDDLQCGQAYGAGHLCLDGRCEAAECRTSPDCAGEVCSGDHRCLPCAGNLDCVGGYGAGHICVLGTCIEAECTETSQCSDRGWLCDLDSFACRTCERDEQCQVDYGDGDYYCATEADPDPAGRCVLGCPAGTACGDSGLCAEDHRCGSCSGGDPARDDVRCQAAYGGLRLCVEGACVRGNCRISDDCVAERLVCVDHLCSPCDRDHPCPDGQVCDAGRCFWGSCTRAGQLEDCQADGPGGVAGYRPCDVEVHACRDCTDDCQAGYICDQGVCVPGDCLVHADCGGGLCDERVCRPCVDDGDCRVELDDAIMRCDRGRCLHTFCLQDDHCAEYGDAPANGALDCRLGACGPNCNACDFTCAPGYHRDGDGCRENNLPELCGLDTLNCLQLYPWEELPPFTAADCRRGECAIVCEQDRWDLDGDVSTPPGAESNGCEYACQVTAALDLPDAEMLDTNCDGLDGMWEDSIFVSPDGDDGHPGTPEQPVASLVQGLVRAVQQGRSQVLAAGGDYGERLALVDGISVHGGYRWQGGRRWAREPGAVVMLASPDPIGLLAMEIEAPTVVSLVNVSAADATEPGQSSMGLLAINCSGSLRFESVFFWAGDGATGGTVDGESGPHLDGEPGGDAGAFDPDAFGDPVRGEGGGSYCSALAYAGAGGVWC